MIQCIRGSGGERTKAAIEKYRIKEAYANGDIDLEGFCAAINRTFNMSRRLGCRSCGVVKKFGGKTCVRCIRFQNTVRDYFVSTPAYLIFHAQKEHERRIAPIVRAAREPLSLSWPGKFGEIEGMIADSSPNQLDRLEEAEGVQRIIDRLCRERGMSASDASDVVYSLVDPIPISETPRAAV